MKLVRISFAIDIPEGAWEETGSDEMPWSRLLAQITINGCPMHLEAYALKDDDDAGVQLVADEWFDEEFEHYNAAQRISSGFAQTTIRGREYVLFATPHGR
jgi:hypothetical protein